MSAAGTPGAQWRSTLDRASNAAKASGRNPQHVLREHFYGQFLARVFAEIDQPWVLQDRDQAWVLKGGVALLARVQDARYSLDIDLLHTGVDVEHAVAELRQLVARDLGDGLRFVVARSEQRHGRQLDRQQRVSIEVYAGAKKRDGFHVDVVTGSLMTTDPETVPARTGLGVPGLAPATYRLYPVVDHIADKVCATQELTAGRPSSRAHDLVDLVVFARTHTVDGDALIEAITTERHHRGLAAAPHLEIPQGWDRAYPKQAAQTPHCDDLDFTAAQALTRAMVEPALDGSAAGRSWSPPAANWVHDPGGAHQR